MVNLRIMQAWVSMFSFIYLSFSTILLAKRTHLVDAISEPENGTVHSLFIEVDDEGDAIALIASTKGQEISFSFDEVKDTDVVLARESGLDAVKLRCANCTPDRGGNVKLTFLKNGLRKTYGTKDLLIVKNQVGWHLETNDRKRIVELFLKASYLLWVPIGIEDVIYKFKK